MSSPATSAIRGATMKKKRKKRALSRFSFATFGALFCKFLFFAFFSSPGAPLELKTPEMKSRANHLLLLTKGAKGEEIEEKNKTN